MKITLVSAELLLTSVVRRSFGVEVLNGAVWTAKHYCFSAVDVDFAKAMLPDRVVADKALLFNGAVELWGRRRMVYG